MGVKDINDPRFPFLAAEVQLLKNVLANKQPVLGICLGAQLLAHAAGARVYPNVEHDHQGISKPAREVGFGNVIRVDEGTEPLFAGLDRVIPVLHWHGDTFDLPVGSVHLAKSDRCQNQAFRLDRHAVGLQFHPEVDVEMVRTWTYEDGEFVVSALGPHGPAQILTESEKRCHALYEPSRRLLGNILDQLLS
jgi:GMP synthase-like glutamine amidotransferase